MATDATPEELRRALERDAETMSSEKSEDFYHLEASTVLDPGELSFEQGDDDDSKILEFRKRRGKTGTDDAGDSEGD